MIGAMRWSGKHRKHHGSVQCEVTFRIWTIPLVCQRWLWESAPCRTSRMPQASQKHVQHGFRHPQSPDHWWTPTVWMSQSDRVHVTRYWSTSTSTTNAHVCIARCHRRLRATSAFTRPSENWQSECETLRQQPACKTACKTSHTAVCSSKGTQR